MDWKTVLLEVTALVGAIAAIIAILNGIYEFRERREKLKRETSASLANPPAPAAPQPAPVPSATADALAPRRLSNLPAQPTALVGREQELAEVRELLLREDVRVVTLTGEAGIGKTRLALRVTGDLLGQFPDGVFFVPLAPVGNPDLVVPTISHVLGVAEQGGRPLAEMLRDHVADKRMLLLLDNFEQVVSAGSHVADLLAAAAGLKVLVTSREHLHLYGEHVYRVPPLAMPELHGLSPSPELPTAFLEYDAVQLFVERAQAAQPGFALTPENALAVAEICARLDCLPLALELAAARIRLLSPQAMLARLVEATGAPSLGLLTGGARDLPARQQTLRNTIDWSYRLLEPPEQALFARLGVFAGGWTLEAAEEMTATGGDGSNLLDLLDSLAGKSLIRLIDPAAPRFMMLQTVHEFALEQLAQAGQEDDLRDAHASWFLELTGRAEPQLYRGTQLEWLAKLDADYENLRAALGWVLEREQASLALRLAGNLARYWNLRGRVSEGRGWLEAALGVGEEQAGAEDDAGARAKALLGLAELISNQGDWRTAWTGLEECVAIARQLSDRRLLARSLATLSLFHVRGATAGTTEDHAGMRALAEESLELARSAGDPWTLGYVLTVLDIRSLLLGDHPAAPARSAPRSSEALACFEKTGDRWGMVLALRHLGFGALAAGDYAAARVAAERSLAASRELGDRLGEAYTVNALGDIARLQEDYEAAERLYQESLALYRELGLRNDIPASLHNLGYLALGRGDVGRAAGLQRQSLALHRENGNQAGMLEALAGIAAVARAQGDLRRAAQLFGAAEALSAALNAPQWPGEQREHERQVNLLRDALGEAELDRARAEGRGLTLDETVAEALGRDGKAVAAESAPATTGR